MAASKILVGRTHTASMLLGHCPSCGLIHPPLESRTACERYRTAAGLDEELSAWRSLKAAVQSQSFDSLEAPPQAQTVDPEAAAMAKLGP